VVISSSTSISAAAAWNKTLSTKAATADFQQQLQAAQSTVPASSASRYARAEITYNDQKVSFEQLPFTIQQQLLEADAKQAEAEAYRARVANDPNVGPSAKIRPYDPAVDEVGMRGLAEMDPSLAKMTPEQIYNYLGSDRANYDLLLTKADAPPAEYRMAEAERRIFGSDPELESKVQMVREYRAEGKPLPDTFAEFERVWRADFVPEALLQEERRKLLEL